MMRLTSIPHDADMITLGLCILDTGGKFPCSKTPKDNGVDSTDPCTGKHRNYRFGIMGM